MATTPRVYKTILSKYQRTRIAGPRFVRGEVFTLSINANGALDDDETLYSATWYTFNNVGIIFGAATVEDRQAHIGCTAGWGPGTWVKVDLTTSSGRVFTQLWQIVIISAPYFQDETFPSPGPASVTAYNEPEPPPVELTLVLQPGILTDLGDFVSGECVAFNDLGPDICSTQTILSIEVVSAIATEYSSVDPTTANCVDVYGGVEGHDTVDITGSISAEVSGGNIIWTINGYSPGAKFIAEIEASLVTAEGVGDVSCQAVFSDIA